MLDMRPVGYVIGLLVATLGLTMIPPLAVDLAEGRGHLVEVPGEADIPKGMDPGPAV